MYLHIGNDKVLKSKDIIGIFDMDTSTVSKHTRDYLNKAEKQGKVIYDGDELPKSFIIYYQNDEIVIYLSQLSSVTLEKRLNESLI